MEKSKERRNENHHRQLDQSKAKSNLVWDCGSTLYDSFELNSFKRTLDSAIINSSRSLSMPHLPDRRVLPRPPPVTPPSVPAPAAVKKSSKLSRSLNKLLRSVFRPKLNSSSIFRVNQDQSKDGFLVVYDKSSTLTTIPEVPEIDFGGFSPEIGSLVRRTESERFAPATAIGISCA
ncbi:uncharacterized protein LOC133778573 [Humulus lupulus]|uniref:uncharacterized protein LOC133778573 n=1 Tax=Humulus lupulus TaxID=3486 RepID=UPI002B403190|nr:uncharacterized protein LOC133778573 [Humulus lupulus]